MHDSCVPLQTTVLFGTAHGRTRIIPQTNPLTAVLITGTIVPIMRTYSNELSIAEALFGKTRRQVLALLFCNPDRDFYLREIMRLAGVGSRGSLERELKKLAAVGLLTRRRRGRQVHYQANAASPVFAEMKSLMTKTAGVADVLSAALAELRDQIDLALVFGSCAAGTDKAGSDIDLLVVGPASFRDVAVAVARAQEHLNREINSVVYSAAEFRQKLAAKHQLIGEIIAGPKIYLIGNDSDLSRLGT